ncbi:hypothetical protein AMATHDRAFT_52483 [Amanita thiersii Skay4041]|uniref:AB hydrolase-1 domain-containing protein n=1 Tax=Amanita thiersii Skay4041 TaxID=703135 RepID=A0A2A9NYL7_9AGAR|nr:hypothetical protein AMATHDRAFT_52483 [Amanita thiersii Skay4041]
MDPAAFKITQTTRNLTYRYYRSLSSRDKPTILLLHGFPSCAEEWEPQVVFLQEKGYGLIVPDMLGYGGTTKPTDPALYVSSLLCQDMIDILNLEKVSKVIAVGHDWGCKVVSGLASRHQNTFLGFGFLAVGYIPPNFNFQQSLALSTKVLGYDNLGYWQFFSEEGVDKLLEHKIDSFQSLLMAEDPSLWKTHLAPTGALKSWLEAERRTEIAPYINPEKLKRSKESMLQNGFAAPLCWYKVMTSGLETQDGESVPLDNHVILKPVFFGGAKRDYVAVSAMASLAIHHYCRNSTVREFDASHWLMEEAMEELNKELLTWIENIM